jgi:hypothetical protein
MSDPEKYVFAANRGFLAYRLGYFQAGASLYSEARSGFVKDRNSKAALMATIYQARAALISGSSDAWTLIAAAEKQVDDSVKDDPLISRLVGSFRAFSKSNVQFKSP